MSPFLTWRFAPRRRTLARRPSSRPRLPRPHSEFRDCVAAAISKVIADHRDWRNPQPYNTRMAKTTPPISFKLIPLALRFAQVPPPDAATSRTCQHFSYDEQRRAMRGSMMKRSMSLAGVLLVAVSARGGPVWPGCAGCHNQAQAMGGLDLRALPFHLTNRATRGFAFMTVFKKARCRRRV